MFSLLAPRFEEGHEGLVLAYHRVAALDADPQRLAVSPQRFVEHIDVLRRYFNLMSLRDLAAGARTGGLPPRAAAITFDDGYADNLEHALPALERDRIPSTVFIASSYPGAGREFWWDDLERILLRPGRLPESLRLQIDGSVWTCNLAGAANYDLAEWRRHAGWNVQQPESPTPRHRGYRQLCELLCALPAVEREAALRDLSEQAVDIEPPRTTHRPLTEDEVASLAAHRLVEIGAHTATHPRLSAVPVETQWEEIVAGKARLEKLAGRDVTSFAYPYGTPSDYTQSTVALVRAAGFRMACTTSPGLVHAGGDPFQLPRLLVRDWDVVRFAGRLIRWFADKAVRAFR
jgi:peptidoglycan/xylan/chitin deacetylase (PgdA/CDA1 family)